MDDSDKLDESVGLQEELLLAYQRIAELEDQKNQYEVQLDELILQVAQRSQRIQEIEQDLQRFTAQKTITPDSSFDVEVMSLPARHGYSLAASNYEMRVAGSVTGGSMYEVSQAEGEETEKYEDSPSVELTNSQSRSPEKRKKREEEREEKQIEEEIKLLRTKIIEKKEKYRELKKQYEAKSQQLNVIQAQVQEFKLSLRLIRDSFIIHFKRDLSNVKSELQEGMELFNDEIRRIQSELRQMNPDRSERYVSYEEHHKAIEEAKSITRAEQELRFKNLIKRSGGNEAVNQLRIEILDLQRERDEMGAKITKLLDLQADLDEDTIAGIETFRRKQLEKNYSELAIDFDDRVKRFQKEIRAATNGKLKMKRSIQNLMISLEEDELKGTVDQKIIDHNKSVLEAILQGRSYFLEKILMESGSSPRGKRARSPDHKVSLNVRGRRGALRR